MKNFIKFSCLACLTLSPLAFADEVYVIANQASGLTADDIKDVFTGEKQIDHGVKLTPYDNTSIRNEFIDKAMHMTTEKYTSIWVKKGFRDGIPQPAIKGTDLEVIAAVKASPGAVGYVSKASPDVKVLKKY